MRFLYDGGSNMIEETATTVKYVDDDEVYSYPTFSSNQQIECDEESMLLERLRHPSATLSRSSSDILPPVTPETHRRYSEDKLSREMQNTYYKLLQRYLVERKRRISLETELSNIREELISCHQHNNSSPRGNVSPISDSKRIDNPPASRVGLISPEVPSDSHAFQPNNTTNVYDKVALVFVVVITIIIIGIIVDNLW